MSLQNSTTEPKEPKTDHTIDEAPLKYYYIIFGVSIIVIILISLDLGYLVNAKISKNSAFYLIKSDKEIEKE